MKVKKIVSLVCVGALCASLIFATGCGKNSDNQDTSNSEVVTTSETVSQEDNNQTQQTNSEANKETSETVSEEAQVAKTGTPYEMHGAISVSGTTIVDESGNPFQLCGVSTHGLGWFPEYVNEDSFRCLRDDFGANIVRLAMYTAEGAGYCTTKNKDYLKGIVNRGVEAATDLGMYVIIDWHILHDLDPNVYIEDSKAFFDEMSKTYKDQDNVIYEICNEPNGGTTWSSVKSYAEQIIPIIRANDPNAIIVVGTPTWSQDVDVAAKDPITGYDNIMYAVHFYADTHKQSLRDKTKVALDKGLPVFITEFSICDASGNGANNISEANTWISFLDENNISFAAWSLCNKAESASIISSGCAKKADWTYDELSESGKWLVGVLNDHSDQGAGFLSGTPKKETNPSDNQNGQNNVTDQNQNQNSGNDTPSTPATGSLGDLTASVSAANSWESGGSTCTQLNVTLKNNGSGNVSGWTLEIDMGQSVTVDSAWCCKTSVSGNKIVITPESYNSTISGKTTTSDIGLIVKTSGKVGTPSISIK